MDSTFYDRGLRADRPVDDGGYYETERAHNDAHARASEIVRRNRYSPNPLEDAWNEIDATIEDEGVRDLVSHYAARILQTPASDPGHELDDTDIRGAWLRAVLEAPDTLSRPEPAWHSEADEIAHALNERLRAATDEEVAALEREPFNAGRTWRSVSEARGVIRHGFRRPQLIVGTRWHDCVTVHGDYGTSVETVLVRADGTPYERHDDWFFEDLVKAGRARWVPIAEAERAVSPRAVHPTLSPAA